MRKGRRGCDIRGRALAPCVLRWKCISPPRLKGMTRYKVCVSWKAYRRGIRKGLPVLFNSTMAFRSPHRDLALVCLSRMLFLDKHLSATFCGFPLIVCRAWEGWVGWMGWMG